jgi:hypothetical protein
MKMRVRRSERPVERELGFNPLRGVVIVAFNAQ